MDWEKGEKHVVFSQKQRTPNAHLRSSVLGYSHDYQQ